MTNDLLNEQLSALVDGELPPEETGLLLKRLEREPQLKARLARYALAGDVLRGERLQAGPQFAMRVAHALATEPAHAPAAVAPAAAVSVADAALGERSAALPQRAPRWLRPLAGLAAAAMVAGLTVFVLKSGPGEPGGAPVAGLAARDAARAAAPDGRVPPVPVLARAARAPGAPATGSEPASYVTPAAQPRVGAMPPGELANYVVAHVQFITPIGRGSVITGLVADEAPAEPAPR